MSLDLEFGPDVEKSGLPLSALSPVDVASNSVGDDAAEDGAILDDFTTHGLERLSSAATCLVAGVEYTHGQQVISLL
ncbi:hypothetical protein TcasGA2_TC006504 [Tribolium castaneum]|uniref:Uncharacterized protein n=1 Tax=Tribolium castaneum TaxID=7070 RepID=D6WX96_TRICA|nr:hypothetical protein TcasGA2_TC006504 [Tribolium castaneum]